MRIWSVLWGMTALAACTDHSGKNDGDSGSRAEVAEAAPAPGKYEVMVSRDEAGLSAPSASYQSTSSVCVSADEAANPRRLILGARADCDDANMRFEGGSIIADLRCAASGGDTKNVPVNMSGVYKKDYWRVTEEIHLFGQTQRETRIYRRTGNCR